MTLPLVSVVVPSLNQAPFLEATLRSLLDQGYPSLEVLVADGGSSDGSVEILRRWQDRLAWWASEPDSGQSQALNLGFSRARGEILAYLNSDDLHLPGTLEKVARFFRQHPEADAVYGDCRVVDGEGNDLGAWRSRPFDLLAELRENFLFQPAVFWRRRVWEGCGSFDESLHRAMDLDLWLRAAPRFSFHYLPRELACFRLHPGSKTQGSRAPGVAERETVLRRFLASPAGERFRPRRRELLTWHHLHAADELLAGGERPAAAGHLLQAAALAPLSWAPLLCLAGEGDALLRTSLYHRLWARFRAREGRLA